MKQKTIRDLAVLVCVFTLGALLVQTSQNVQGYKKERKTLQADIAKLQEEIHALELEWLYLNRPQRLHNLAIEHTNLRPPDPAQIKDSMMMETSTFSPQEGKSEGQP